MIRFERENKKWNEIDVYVGPGIDMQFDPFQKFFIINSDSHGLVNLFPQETSDFLDLIPSGLEHKNARPAKENETLFFTYLGLAELPFMRKELAKLSQNHENLNTAIELTKASMKAVYEKLEPTVKLPKKSSVNFINFNASIEDNGLFRIFTFGNCACCGPDGDTHAVSGLNNGSEWKDNINIPASYGFHNVDKKVELASLLAGAGTLAYITRNGFDGLNE